jgi:hypothetical protein
MHLRLTGFVLWSLASTLSWATPPDIETIDERLLGETDKDFSVLRVEDNNLGSYYLNRQKVYLVERSKADGRSVKETLLTDITKTTDATHEEPNTPAPVSSEVHAKDGTLLLGEVLARYPLVPVHSFEAGVRERFRVVDESILFGDRLEVMDATTIARDVFGGRMADVPARLVDVQNAGATIYLKLTKEDDSDGGRESRWVAVPSRVMQQIRASQAKETIYLAAGSFPTVEEARGKLAEWRELCRTKKVPGFDPEIWSSSAAGGKFAVVLRNSGDLIRREKFAEIGTALDQTLLPISGEKLLEWMPEK